MPPALSANCMLLHELHDLHLLNPHCLPSHSHLTPHTSHLLLHLAGPDPDPDPDPHPCLTHRPLPHSFLFLSSLLSLCRRLFIIKLSASPALRMPFSSLSCRNEDTPCLNKAAKPMVEPKANKLRCSNGFVHHQLPTPTQKETSPHDSYLIQLHDSMHAMHERIW